MKDAEMVDVMAAADLDEGGARVVKKNGSQLALFRHGGSVLCVDNRCPHEGLPLSQGSIKDGVLTCPWHNWKFEAATGRCIEGGEDVRAYDVRTEGGRIRVDLTPEPPSVALPRRIASLRRALEEHKIGQAARDSVRLLGLGATEQRILAEGARYGAEHAEYGFDHGLAALSACAASPGVPGMPPAVRLAQALSMVTETNVRQPVRRAPEPRDPGPELGTTFRRAIEDEDASTAEALLRGAVTSGAPPVAIREAVLGAATDHFLGYGHGLIYAVRALELLDALGDEGPAVAPSVLGSLAPMLAWLTREDVLPYMASYRKAMAAMAPRLAGLSHGTRTDLDAARLAHSLLDGTADDAMGTTLQLLEDGVAPPAVASAIAAAAGERLLRFDLSVDQDPSQDVGWLDVTHLVTFPSAARFAVEAWPSPESLRALLQAAWFVSYVSQADLPPERRPRVEPLPLDPDGAADALARSIVARDPEGAVGAAAALLEGAPPPVLAGVLWREALSDHASSFIMGAHVIKTTQAALAEAPRVPPSLRAPLVLGLVRFLAAPRKERFVTQNAVLADRMVRERGI